MSTIFKSKWMIVLMMVFALSSCSLNEATTTPEDFRTQAAQTAEVRGALTDMAATPTFGISLTPAISLTPEASNTPLITNTNTPGGPTNTPFPTSTPRPSSGTACDNALFIDNVTMPDFSTVAPGTTFFMEWRFKNLGPCTWTTGYEIAFTYVSDTGKDGIFDPPEAENFPAEVLPGDETDIGIHITAPTEEDGYQVVFRLRNEKGFYFGPEFWLIFSVE